MCLPRFYQILGNFARINLGYSISIEELKEREFNLIKTVDYFKQS